MEYKLETLEKAAELESSGSWQEMLKFCQLWTINEPKNHLAWQGLGDSLAELGKFAEAISMYQNGLEVAPKHPVNFLGTRMSAGPLWYRLGNAYDNLGKTDLSIAAFLEAVRVDPKVGDSWNNLGTVYLKKNDTTNALEAFRNAVQISPHEISFLRNLGIVHARCGKEVGVVNVYKILLRLDASFAHDYLMDAKQILSTQRQ